MLCESRIPRFEESDDEKEDDKSLKIKKAMIGRRRVRRKSNTRIVIRMRGFVEEEEDER